MKQSTAIVLLLVVSKFSIAQFDKPVTFRATVILDPLTSGIYTDDAAIGVGLDASFFSTKRLQLVVETSWERFFGNKVHYSDSLGKITAPAIWAFRAGPQFFITKSVALSITYGPAWHVMRGGEYNVDDGFRYTATAFIGRQKHVLAKVFYVNMPTDLKRIRYLGFAAGYRF